MKKQIIMAVLGIMLMILMAGCSDDQSASTIKKWQPQDKETQIVLDMLTVDNYSVGAFHTGREVKSVSFGYDYYKGSKLIKDRECGLVNLAEDQRDGLVGVSLAKGAFQAFCAEKDSGGGSVAGTLDGWKKGDDSEQAFSGLESEKAFTIGEKCYIAVIAKGGNMADPETMLSEKHIMKQNDKNWLFYVIFD